MVWDKVKKGKNHCELLKIHGDHQNGYRKRHTKYYVKNVKVQWIGNTKNKNKDSL